MTPQQFRAAISRLGLTQGQAASFLGCNIRSISYWCAGRHVVPVPVAKLLHLMIETGYSPDDVG
jgi:DNA-binding transcriptional regulator YiaG